MSSPEQRRATPEDDGSGVPESQNPAVPQKLPAAALQNLPSAAAQASAPVEMVHDVHDGFAPLKIPLFRDRWIASTVSNLGTWMQDTAGTWLMTALTSSPLLIALMLTAASLPVLLFGLLAGATADIFDRRRLLIFWQIWMLVSVGLLAVFTLFGIITPWTLLILTFLLNVGSAMNNPAWQAIVPELVPREQIPNAVTLNSISNNLARALGPALGGLLVAAFTRTDNGAGWVFFLNAVSFAGVIWVLVNWRSKPLFKSALPAERIAGSIRSGLRYVRYAPGLQASLVHAFVFPFFVSSVWSLLAVVAKRDLNQGAMGYGILNGCLGLGAIGGATLLPRVRRHLSSDGIIIAASFVYSGAMLVLGLVHVPWIVMAVLVLGGFSWTSTMATLNASVQLSVPAWVQARALGTYLMIFQGGLASGSALWGAIAEHSSTTVAFLCATAGFVIVTPFTMRFHVLRGAAPDLSPYQYKRPLPTLAVTPDPEDGPVRISVEYNVPLDKYEEFTHCIHALRAVRMRGGAMRWGIYRDAENPEKLEETFVVESWLDYLRSRERMTEADSAIRARAYALNRGPELPKVMHQIYAKEASDNG